MEPNRIKVFSRILVFAILLGIIEDFLAIAIATDAVITLKTIIIIIIIAVIFAIIGELVIDKTRYICPEPERHFIKKKK